MSGLTHGLLIAAFVAAVLRGAGRRRGSYRPKAAVWDLRAGPKSAAPPSHED